MNGLCELIEMLFRFYRKEDWLDEHNICRLQHLPQQHWYMHLCRIYSTDWLCKGRGRIKTTPNSECALNALAIDNPLEYARLYLDGTMQMWIDAEDSLEVW